MTQFRLTQISDTHLARRIPKLTRNFEQLANYVDATRPDLVLNTGDVCFDGPSGPGDLDYARALHDALPVPCRYLPGNHDIGDNPTQIGPMPTESVSDSGGAGVPVSVSCCCAICAGFSPSATCTVKS